MTYFHYQIVAWLPSIWNLSKKFAEYANKKSLSALDGQKTQRTHVESPSEVGRCRFDQETEERWSMEWAYYNPTNWTRMLIQDPIVFYKKTCRNVDYHTILTGHGIFNHYRYRICKETHTRCWNCEVIQDDDEHVLVRCPRWAVGRPALESDIGAELKLGNDVIGTIVWRILATVYVVLRNCNEGSPG
jgi:hypothetical protein